ncbi:MAG TPA: CoA ester lyase [Terriglobia bacterium]|nr:CoA ester lyase [Terriglobia bacterium]
MTPSASARPASIRPRRSVLYLPGSNARALEKARELPADALILDLEDAVAPEAKESARQMVAEAVRTTDFGHREVVVRVNGLDTPWGLADVMAMARIGADALLFPKIQSPQDVRTAVAALDRAGAPGSLPVWIMAETPRCILDIDAIASASHRLACIVAGTSDLTRELRARHTASRDSVYTALSLTVLAARAHGLDVLDGVHLDLGDEAGFAFTCEQGRNMGFDGRTLIHPKQIDVANRVFAPTEKELELARRVVAAWDEARAAGKGICVVDNRLIEKLHVEEFERLLTLDVAIAKLGTKPAAAA